MASQDKKISSLTEWLYQNVEDAANIVVAHFGSNYRIALSTLRRYVLGNREIGGIGSRDITTNTDAQTLTQKRLDSPSFNNDVKLNWNVSATQLNFLSGLNVNVNQVLNTIGSDIMTIEDRLDNLVLALDTLQADKVYSTGIGVGGGATSITIDASSISNDKINPYSLSISVYEQTSPLTMQLLNLSKIDILISDDILSSITIADVVSGKSYQIVIRYRVAT